ncbi:MAG: hypothetical protein OEM96_05690, partial [Gemmatimonadota bacterium]|nr:hypothetical protein [Gemmatimonadota bacterium]
RGQLLAAPFSVRPVPGALVSAPLKWTEVTRRLRIEQYTIRSMPGRLERLGSDPLFDVLELRPDLPAALARLAGQLSSD